MALPRIRYSVDGTLVWAILPDNTLASLNSTQKAIMDGDLFVGNTVEFGSNPRNVLFNFPATLKIDSIKLKILLPFSGISFKVSTNSTDGFDGDWSTLLTDDYDYGYTYQSFDVSPTEQLILQGYI